MSKNLCPCHSQKAYKDCCELYHKGTLPKTAEALMRSRFSGYALALIDYIIETTHPDYQPQDRVAWRKEILDFSEKTLFEGLEILSKEEGPSKSFVTFTAHLKRDNQDVSFTEKSSFALLKGRWLYCQGQILK